MIVRKKAIEVEARQLTEDNALEIAAWCEGAIVASGMSNEVSIYTLEGEMRASLGDWIIRGVQGEFYPCKPHIFEQTYDIVDDDEIIDFVHRPLTLEVVSIVEQDDGSAHIVFDMDMKTLKLFSGIGIKKVLMDSVEAALENEN